MPQIEYGDKIGHLLAYASLTGWFSQLYARFSMQLWIFLAFVIMGVGLEIIQGMGGVRMFEYADMLANTLGAVLGWVLSRTWLVGSLLKVDQFLSSRF